MAANNDQKYASVRIKTPTHKKIQHRSIEEGLPITRLIDKMFDFYVSWHTLDGKPK